MPVEHRPSVWDTVGIERRTFVAEICDEGQAVSPRVR